MEALYDKLCENYGSVWFVEHGYTVHFGPGEERKVTVRLKGPKEVEIDGPGHLAMDVEELLQDEWTIV